MISTKFCRWAGIAAKVSTACSYISITSIDASTSDGRDRERIRRISLTLLGSVFSQASTFLLMVFSMRLALPILGTERYGVLATILSVALLLSFVDFGLSNALIGHIARLKAGDNRALRRSVSSAFWLLCLLGAVSAIALALFARYGPLEWALSNPEPGVLAEAREALVWFSLIFGVSLPLGGVQRVFWGLQRGYISHSISGLFSVFAVAVLLLMPLENAGMPTFLWLSYGLPVASGVVLLATIYRRGWLSAPSFAPKFSITLRTLTKESSFYFLLQLGVVAGWGCDNLILSATIGPTQVATLVVATRIGQFITLPLQTLNSPLWAAYADAHSRRDTTFIRRVLITSITATAVAATAIAGMLLAGREFLASFLSNNTIILPSGFFAAFLLSTVLAALANGFAMYLNGTQIIRPQVICVSLFILVSIPLKVYSASTFGLTGLMVGTMVAFLITTPLPYLTVFRKAILEPISVKSIANA